MSDASVVAAIGVGGALAKPVVETACELARKMLGVPCGALSAVVTDQFLYWQWLNRVRIFNGAAVRLKNLGIEAQPAPPGFLIPFI